jgi:transcriptional regulator with XRE-family HTH domain
MIPDTAQIEPVLDALREIVKREGTMRAAAKAMGVSLSYVSDVLAGKRLPGQKILAALRLRKIVTFEADCTAAVERDPCQ